MNLFDINLWGSKPRTMLRFIKPEDVFIFRICEDSFGFCRILSKVSLGYFAEIFDSILKTPVITHEALSSARILGAPLLLEAYSLFDRILEGEWQIVAHDGDFILDDYKYVYFVYGHPNSWGRVDVFGNNEAITDSEASLLPKYSPRGDGEVKEMFRQAV